jgi:peptidyl-prolyl cis-trans isomerase SurA
MTKILMCSRRLMLGVVLAVLPSALAAEVIEQILVKVNGEIFTKTDLEARQVAALRQRGLQSDKNPGDEQLREALNMVTPQIMVDAVSEMLMVQRGKELGYKLTDEQFKSIVDNIRKENKLDSDEKFKAALKQENMTEADLRRQIERNVLVSRVQQVEVFGKIGITEDEARLYYDAHLQEFTTPATVTLREILISVPNDGKTVNVGQDEAAKEKTEQLRSRAVAGENFEKLAADFSDSPSKANAGLIGPISLNDLSPDLRKVVETMKTGDVTQALRTPRGYQLIKVESLKPSEIAAFEQAREQISDRVVTGKRKEEFDKYLAKLKSQAIIEWKNADVQKAYEQGLVELAKPS